MTRAETRSKMEFLESGEWMWLPKGRQARKGEWEGEVKKKIELEKKLLWLQREESFNKMRYCGATK